VGCATASIVPEIGYESVQLNAFCLPGKSYVIARLADHVEQWEHASRARELLAHVSNPTSEQVGEWIEAGFEHLGTRQRMVRTVTERDKQIEVKAPDGVDIITLRDQPQLADQVLRVWNECHRDIPTVVPFLEISMHGWREELGLGNHDSFPDGLQVAVAGGEVVGISYVAPSIGRSGMAGHRFSGVSRAWRGRGICTALKLASIQWAALRGISELQASNDESNNEMKAVNRKLGYRESFTIDMLRRSVRR
jgi:RimJ/RimL family protein N-acetyltransferase